MNTPDKAGLSLRISLTDKCQLKCLYCVPAGGIAACEADEMLSYDEIAGFISFLKSGFGLTKVRFTGGEPLLRQGVEELVGKVRGMGVPDLAMTTNGLALSRHAKTLSEAGLMRINVSLDSLNPMTYRELSRGGNLNSVLSGIKAARRWGLSPIKINMVLLRGINDSEVADFVEFGLEFRCEVRFLELMPIGEARAIQEERFISTDEIRTRLAEKYELIPVPSEGYATARRYEAVDKNGARCTIGFISPCSSPFCEGCCKLRLTSAGRLIGCLASEDGVDIKPLLRPAIDAVALESVVRSALGFKKSPHLFARRELMGTIGG